MSEALALDAVDAVDGVDATRQPTLFNWQMCDKHDADGGIEL